MVGQVRGNLPVLGCSAHPAGWSWVFTSTGRRMAEGPGLVLDGGGPRGQVLQCGIVLGPEFYVMCVWDKSPGVP